MKYIPRKHQVIAQEFLRSHDHGALFLEQGLGKTVVTMTMLREYIYDEFCVDRALVIAPKRVAEDTWSREADKWDHLHNLRIAKILGSAKQRKAAAESNADIYVINRENVQWLVEQYGTRWKWDAVVIDELSSFKSTHAKRWRMLKRILPTCRVVWGLTGTPASNGYMDLFAEVFLLDGGKRLGRTLTAYRDTYFNPGAHKGHIVYEWRLKPGAKERIDHALKDLCLSMSAKDWLDMPERIDIDHVVHLSASERRVYDQFQRDKVLPLLGGKLTESIEDADNAILGSTAATVSGKLLQMSGGEVYDDEGNVFHIHDAKMDALEEIIEAANGEPVLVYYGYKHELKRMMDKFPKAETLDAKDAIARWNRGEIPVLLCHPASVAYGLNLQESSRTIVWYSLPWSCELYQQANSRLWRQGQERTVFIHHLITQDTIDGRVMQALGKKGAVQNSLLEALKDYLFNKEETK